MSDVKLPETGRTDAAIFADLDAFEVGDPAYKEGRLWSLVYHLNDTHETFLGRAYQMFASANGLNPGAFQSLKRMETEVIAMLADLLNGPADTCGVMTAGGTESCLLAVKTYRDMARKKRRVKRPNMVLPASAHVAWFKGAEYFGVEARVLPLDADLKPDLEKLKKRIDGNTILVVASAPNYPHGIIDPVTEMAGLIARRRIPLHVDACIGGMILPFMAMNGAQLPEWDFRVPGVTSMSVDLHKYGYAAKGASAILYRDFATLKHQIFVSENWPGGVFASSGLLGTRPGGAYAAAWAAMQRLGVSGYRRLAEETMEAADALREGVEGIEELKLLGAPAGPILAIGAARKGFPVLAVADRMEARGWSIDRLQRPAGLHLMVTAQHRRVVEAYLGDLRRAVAEVREHPELGEEGRAATYGMIAHVPLRGRVKEKVRDIFAEMYRAGGGRLDLDGGAPEGFTERMAARYAKWRASKE